MANVSRIRTPWTQHWRRIRYQLLPVVLFVGAAATAVWLWGRHVGLPNAVGEVNVVRVDAVSPVDGRLVAGREKPLQMFDLVQAGDEVARLDDAPTAALLATLRAELGRLRQELASAEVSIRQDQAVRRTDELTESRRLALDIEKLRLDILDRQAEIETDQIAGARLDDKHKAVAEQVQKGLEPRLTLVDIEIERDVIAQRVVGNRKALEEAEKQRAECDRRLAAFAVTPPADIQTLLAPVREAITVQEAAIREAAIQADALVVRAPITGTVTALYAWAGQNVQAGMPILTIAATEGQYIVSYVRQEQRIRPVVGMPVEVTLRTLPRQHARSRVEEIGPQVEPVPLHQLADPNRAEWGLPVRIAIPVGLAVRPGELVDVAFKPASSAAN